MSDTPPLIEKIEYFSCGYCKNRIEKIFKKTAKGEIKFPAGVFLIKHRFLGYILYDTGYGSNILNNKPKYLIYRAPNPVFVKKEDIITEQLKKKGIDEKDIKYVILSHLHPDHIGSAEKFSKARFIITGECRKTLKKNNFKELVFKEFLPKDFEKRLTVVDKFERKEDFPLKLADLFGDKSIYMASVDGHAKGQGCLLIKEKNLFIGADMSWGMDLIEYTENMRLIPALVQNDFNEYKKGTEVLKSIQKKGIEVLVSHDPEERTRKILNEKNIFDNKGVY